MTDMMVKATQNRETQRANRASEAETKRSNQAREKETYRSNKAKESETARSNKAKEKLKSQENLIKTVDTGFKIGSTLGAALANDPDWYLEGDPNYILGTVPDNFGNPLGPMEIVKQVGVNGVSTAPVEGAVAYHPGIMGLDITLAYGIASGKYSDPINKASKTLFTKIQTATSYSKTYQANDMSMYLMAFDSLFAMLSAAKRAYGLTNLSSVINRYVSRGYVMASGFDFDDLTEHLADYRKRINSLITLTRDFNLPHLYIYNRHEQLFSSVYLDYDSQKSQAYIPRLSDAYQYALVEKEGTVIGELQLKTILPPGGSVITMKAFLDKVEEFYNSFANNTDFATISGDMGRAFQDDLWFSDTIPEDYTVIPGREDLMLQQIRNSTVVPIPNPTVFGALTQDTKGTGYLISYVNYTGGDSNNKLQATPQEAYLGYWHGEVITKPMVLDTSRMVHFAELRSSGTTIWYDVKECGTDIVKQTYIYVYQGGSTAYDDAISVDIIPGDLDGLENPADAMRKVANLAQFENHPLIYGGQDSAGWLTTPIWDFDNYRKFSRQDFAYMNEAALRSVLGANK